MEYHNIQWAILNQKAKNIANFWTSDTYFKPIFINLEISAVAFGALQFEKINIKIGLKNNLACFAFRKPETRTQKTICTFLLENGQCMEYYIPPLVSPKNIWK